MSDETPMLVTAYGPPPPPASKPSVSWSDKKDDDPLGRTHLHYWMARALEAAYHAPNSAIGVTCGPNCTSDTGGADGVACAPTTDPFPSKPYFYVLQPGDSPETVGVAFGGGPMGWVQLRRANADDEDGFVMSDGKCSFKSFEPGKRVRIPGHWSEAAFDRKRRPFLVDGFGDVVDLEGLLVYAHRLADRLTSVWKSPDAMRAALGDLSDEDTGRLLAMRFRRPT